MDYLRPTALEVICDRVEMDLGLICSRCFPYREDIQRLLEYAYDGRQVDFLQL